MVRQMPMAEFMSTDRYSPRRAFRTGTRSQRAAAAERSDVHGRMWHYRADSRWRRRIVPTMRSRKKRKSNEIIAATPPIGSSDQYGRQLLAIGSATLAGEIESAKGIMTERSLL